MDEDEEPRRPEPRSPEPWWEARDARNGAGRAATAVVTTLVVLGGLVVLLVGLPVLVQVGQLAAAFGREHHQWRQALTVTVETPAGERTGRTVVEVGAWFGQQPLSANEVSYEVTGEATAVEVAPGRWLFALLGGSQERYACAVGSAMGWQDGPWVRNSPVPEAEQRRRGEWLAEVPRQVGRPPVALPERCLPQLVTFDNLADPASVREVNPDNLAATFGPGVRLAGATIAVTEEPLTEGRVGGVLPWLATIGDGGLDGTRFRSIDAPNRLADDLGRWEFRKP